MQTLNITLHFVFTGSRNKYCLSAICLWTITISFIVNCYDMWIVSLIYYLILLIGMIWIMCVCILCFLCAMQMNSSHPNEKLKEDYKAFPLFQNLIELRLLCSHNGIHDWSEVLKLLQNCPKIKSLYINKVTFDFHSINHRNRRFVVALRVQMDKDLPL